MTITGGAKQAERAAARVNRGEWTWAPLECPTCGGKPNVDRWSSEGQGIRETEGEGYSIRMVADAPEWAVPFALQGVDMVSRYTCGKCGHEIAVVARDE
ncbi:hypothetical protein ACFL6C_05500 [Myxococcota bacterium]